LISHLHHSLKSVISLNKHQGVPQLVICMAIFFKVSMEIGCLLVFGDIEFTNGV